MDSLIKFTPESLENNDAFLDHILSIIDTKLQFIEYRTSKIIKSAVDEPNAVSDSAFHHQLEYDVNQDMKSDKMLNHIEEYSRTTSLLLLMRVNLSGKNASLVFDLLSEDKFLNFEDIDLEKKLIDSLS